MALLGARLVTGRGVPVWTCHGGAMGLIVIRSDSQSIGHAECRHRNASSAQCRLAKFGYSGHVSSLEKRNRRMLLITGQ